jgi:hypothetical protein
MLITYLETGPFLRAVLKWLKCPPKDVGVPVLAGLLLI